MDKFTTVSGAAAPMLRANVDTDVIIPIQRLVGTGRTGLGPYAFERMRYNKDGSDNPDFVLNLPQYRDSPILLAGPNFGCGSSREGAVWALMGMGFRCGARAVLRRHLLQQLLPERHAADRACRRR